MVSRAEQWSPASHAGQAGYAGCALLTPTWLDVGLLGKPTKQVRATLQEVINLCPVDHAGQCYSIPREITWESTLLKGEYLGKYLYVLRIV